MASSDIKLLTYASVGWRKLSRSVWLFPVVLAFFVMLLTVFRVSGSSIGYYNDLFYGKAKDSNLLINKPQGIRSDEWLVNTQMTLAQKNNDFERVNKNVGNGEDVSLMFDIPYKDWSSIFKPLNLVFYIMPFDNAFAFKWWSMAYLLIVSSYFFCLSLLPGRRLLAALLSTSFYFSPFIQWWYLNGTLTTISFGLLAGVLLMKLISQKSIKHIVLWATLLAYILVCFSLILYPPFQIPVAIVMLVFSAGYCFEKFIISPRHLTFHKLGAIITAMVVAGAITATFLATRADVVKTVQSTAYPGKRLQKSGGYDFDHLFSSHLGAQQQFASKANHYSMNGPTNQSESSNFILLLPFLLIPSIYLIRLYSKLLSRIDWPLILVNLAFLLALLWLFVPNLGVLGKITQLERVPHNRLLIGLGVLSFIQIILFMRRYSGFKNTLIGRRTAMIYSIAVLASGIGFGLYAMHSLPGFIDIYRVLAFAAPIPLIIYLLLRKRFEWAIAILLLFSLAMTFRINPLYRGVDILDKTPISQTIRTISAKDNSRWATDHFLLENFVFMNGARSLSGVYAYPQLELWNNADPAANSDIYNRYAHTVFTFDRDPTKQVPTKILLTGGDTFTIITEPCGKYLKEQGVRYLLTGSALSYEEKCTSLIEQINYPATTFFVYYIK